MVTELYAVKEFHHKKAALMFSEYFGGRVEKIDGRFLVWYIIDEEIQDRRNKA